MKKESIEILILFSKETIQTELMLQYFNKLQLDLFGKPFDELSYSIRVKSHLKDKTLKYNEKNLLKMLNENPSDGFELLSLLPNWNYKSSDILFSSIYTPDFRGYSSIQLAINKNIFCEKYHLAHILNIFINLIYFIKKNGNNFIYGFTMLMENAKHPSLFVTGIGSDTLTKKEEQEAFLWNNNKNRSASTIWQVFWGNLITTKHLKSFDSLEKIKTIVGEKNFYIIDATTYFFHLPTDDLTHGHENQDMVKDLSALLNTLI